MWRETYLVTEEEELPYWHLKHEVVLAEAEADVGNSSVEEAGGSEHQDQVEVPGEWGLDDRKESQFFIYLFTYLLSVITVHEINKVSFIYCMFLISNQDDSEFKATNTICVTLIKCFHRLKHFRNFTL